MAHKTPLIMLETDYLIIGCGAVAMAFVDTLLTESDANILIIDRNAKPGGHWNVAYPFVTLHQPSQFYGVSSKELSNGQKDELGWNKGLHSLATGAEVCAYFDEVMQKTFLPTRRVQYFPMCDYKGDNAFESLITGKKYQVEVHKKIVDTTILGTAVPATHTPNFKIEEGVSFMPLNDLPKIAAPPAGFVIVGGGKTGIDAILWLLENQVNPDDITWIVSRDAWLINRKKTQPSMEFFGDSFGTLADQLESIAKADSIPNLFDRLEEIGFFVRIDNTIRPQMFHGATVSELELEQLQRIKNIIRLGRVQCIERDQIILEKGSIPTTLKHIHVDCSASAVTNLEMKPVFEGKLITPQTVRSYQPVFSGSIVAYVEANYSDDKVKNKLCQVVPLPNHDTDWIRMMSAQLENQFIWSKDKELRKWLVHNRLNGFGNLVKEVDKNDLEKKTILQRIRKNSLPAMIKLQDFTNEMEAAEAIKKERPQLQVKRALFFKNRVAETPVSALSLEEGEILLKIEKFAYTANNITYAAAGDMIGYWQFFPPMGTETNGWGVIPVWGFAEVVESKAGEIPVGDRLFGYFPPAKFLKMKPVGIKAGRLIDGSEHRAHLPAGYNFYRRVLNEKNYNPAFDRERMLLFPLHLTSFCIWDYLQDKQWFGVERIIILSASSKTSSGLAYALHADENAPPVTGITSKRNLEMVQSLGIYDECLTYEEVENIDPNIPTAIVDMAGNAKIMVALHSLLQDNMKYTINVGITHWADARPQEGLIAERSEFFFAPGHMQKRMKEWGAAVFDQKSAGFMMETAAKTKQWLSFRTVKGIEELAAIHPAVCAGKISANEGLIVEV